MKKIALFSLIMFLGAVDAGFAGSCKKCEPTYKCNVQSLSSMSWKVSNEFLFTNDSAHDHKMGLVCGHRTTNGCNDGIIVVVGNNHVWKNDKHSGLGAYGCSASGANAWNNIGVTDFDKCNDDQMRKWKYFGQTQDYNDTVKIYCETIKDAGVYGKYCYGDRFSICVDKGCSDCNKPEPKPDPKPKTCEELYAGNADLIKCCKAKDAEVNNGVCKCNDSKKEWKDGKCVTKNGPVPVVGCSKYAKGTEAYDCCVHPDATWDEQKNKCFCKRYDGLLMRSKWSWGKDSNGVTRGQCIPNIHVLRARCCLQAGGQWIPNDEDEWDGRCDCGAGKTLNFSAESNVCECVGGNPVVNPTDCTPSGCEITIKQSVLCNNGHYLSSTETYGLCKEDLNARNLNCEQFKAKVNSCKDVDCIRQWLTRLDAYDELIARVCKDSGNAPVVNPNAEIEEAKRTLVEFFKNTEDNKNVWRDEEGKFNTVRLASDLTAGVVLGTVGGVVSGVVIKKKQVEKGFDALHCTVGGQNIADWGDTFNVGLRR